jgi:hypothetical protein
MGQEHYEGAEEVYLDSAQDGMGLASNTDNNGTLLHCLGGIFDLEDSALGRAWRRLAC